MQIFLKAEWKHCIVFLFSCLFLSWAINLLIGQLLVSTLQDNDVQDIVDGLSWSWSGKSHQHQVCNFNLLSGMLLLSHNAKERLEKKQHTVKITILKLKDGNRTRLTAGRIVVQNLCQIYEHKDGESLSKYKLHCKE